MRHNLYKLTLLFLFLIFLPSKELFSQNNNHELQQLINWDVGPIGTWVNYEHPIAENWVLLGDFGANFIFFGGAKSTGFAVSGRVALGARNYFDRKERILHNKSVINNSGNFFQIVADIQPGLNYLYEKDGIFLGDRKVVNELRLIPSLGTRRNIGKSRWHFEGRFGVGYSYRLEDYRDQRKHNIGYDLRLAIGYTIFRK